MPFERRTVLPGSENVQRPGLEPGEKLTPEEAIQVSIILRRRRETSPAAMQTGVHRTMSHSDFQQAHGANPSDIQLVEEYAHEMGLTVVEANAQKRRVVLAGTAQQLQHAFGAELVEYRSAAGHKYRGRTGTLSIPMELEHAVKAILGFDARPVAKPHFRRKQQAPAGSFTPAQIAALYSFPAGLTGKGQTIALIELGGGYRSSDLTTYFKNQKVTPPKVTAVSVDGAKNTPGSDADAEVLLDIEVAGAIAHDANIAVYFAPNTDAGFVDAITNAVHDTVRKPSVISISWGGPEDSWSKQSRDAMNAVLQDAATLGITVTVAAGDDGSSDGVGDQKLHVDFPASSPFALACGGTTLKASGSKITSETVWNEVAQKEGATGGGISNAFPVPAYQQTLHLPKQPQTQFAGRGVPDVAGDADPSTGYQVRVNGQDTVIGGTSAVAPLWAALVAQINQQLGKPVGFLNPKLYTAGQAVFHDITSGNNDDANLGAYKAQTGWDACTGLGTPNGTGLLKYVSGSASDRIEVTGSELQHSPDAVWSDIRNPAAQIVQATIVLRRSGGDWSDALLSGAEPALIYGEAATATAASPEDIATVTAFAQKHGMKVTDANPIARTMKIEGTAEQMASAFGVQLGHVHGEGKQHLTYRGALTVPQNLGDRVMAVLGLDQRPIARHHTASGHSA